MRKHYSDVDGFKALSCNAIITEIKTNRNYGKTWLFQKRAFRRAIKRGKKTLWLRLFDNEVKEAKTSLFASADLQKYCGCSWYNKKTNPDGNIYRNGNTFYCRRSKNAPWFWFLKVFNLGNHDAVRSADDVKVDTIVCDEFLKPRQIYSRYHGIVADDLTDIFFSAKREHQVRIFVLGNKENVYNPVETYFKIKPLPSSFEGIKKYRKGSFVVQQINNVPPSDTEYDKKVKALYEGTAYGNFLYNNDYHFKKSFKQAKTPRDARIYVQSCINGQAVKICVLNGLFYASQNIDTTEIIYCDDLQGKYKHERQLVKRLKRFFIALINAVSDNRVRYADASTREACEQLYKWLTI